MTNITDVQCKILPNRLPVRQTVLIDNNKGTQKRVYHNREFSISMIAIKKVDESQFTTIWVCNDLKGQYDSYDNLRAAWSKRICKDKR